MSRVIEQVLQSCSVRVPGYGYGLRMRLYVCVGVRVHAYICTVYTHFPL